MSALDAPPRDRAAPAAAVQRAEAARVFLAEHLRRRRPSLFALYALLVGAGVFGVLAERVLARIVGGGLAVRTVADFGPAALGLLVGASLRYGVWQGPIGFRVPDVNLVLMAPVSVGTLVRPRLDRALAAAAVLGTLFGTVVALLSAGGVVGLGPARSVLTAVGFGAVAVLLIAGGWCVQSTPALTRWVARLGPLLALAAAALLVSLAGHGGELVAVWSGPWGWVLAGLLGTAGWPVAAALLLGLTAAVVALARRRVGSVRALDFVARAEVRTGMATAAFVLDYRGATLLRRAARSGSGRSARRRLRIPRPRSARLAIPWRDAVAVLRDPARTGWGALVAAGAVTEAVTHPGRGLPALVAAVGLYAAAALLLEPLRAEVDRPDRGAVLLSRSFARLLLAHCALPVSTLLAVEALTLAGLALTGVAGSEVLALAPTLAAVSVAVAVLCAAMATRRGGRIGPELLAQILSLDPSSPMVLLAVVFLAPWLLVTAAALTATTAIVGSAAAGHHPLADPTVAATLVLAVVAAVLARLAVRSPSPSP